MTEPTPRTGRWQDMTPEEWDRSRMHDEMALDDIMRTDDPTPRTEADALWQALMQDVADPNISLAEYQRRFARHRRAIEAQARTEALDWPTLANIIREVDGNHDLGAGELAERILAHPRFQARTEALDVEVLQSALWALMKRDGWRIATGASDLPPNAVVEAIAAEYQRILAAKETPSCRCVTKDGVRQPTFGCPVHSPDLAAKETP